MKFHTNVYLLSFSAFFADLGYQVVVGGLSIFLVIVLHSPIWVYALIEALSFGIGSLFSFLGGRLSDRFDPKKLSIIGNSLIPIMSFTGLVKSYSQAGSLYIGGWWARNFRSPPRRVLMIESTSEQERSNAFGLLHGLDVGGGMLASILLFTLFYLHYQFDLIFIISVFPLIISTLLIAVTKKTTHDRSRTEEQVERGAKNTYTSIMFAAALFGFSSYSIGFPILTGAQYSSSILLGLLAFIVFMTTSSAGGFLYSAIRPRKEVRQLSILGYILSGLGSLGISIVLFTHLPIEFYYIPIAILGLGTAGVETFEPTIISRISRGGKTGSGMGSLSFFRSIGMFSGILVLGFLYLIIGAQYAYLYPSAVAIAGGIIVLVGGRNFTT